MSYRRVHGLRGLAFNCFELLPPIRRAHCARRLETIRDMSVREAATVCTRTTAVLRVSSFYIAMLRALFHLLVLVHHTYVSYHLLTQIDFSKSDDEYVHNVMKKFKLRYFTSWNFVSSILFGLSNVASSTA